MNNTPIPDCKRCHFYHGDNGVVCALHPYGPDSETCSDYVPKTRGLNQSQTIRDRWSIHQFYNWKVWREILMLWMLVGIFGTGCVLGWLTTYPTASTIKTTNNIRWVVR